jgi:crossover junction endodeoxyribonuclease RusA
VFLFLPFEFCVVGTPVSAQGSARSKAAWRDEVRNACRPRLPADYFALTQPISVTMFHFSEGSMSGDLDNVVKPVLDAMKSLVYVDDSLVHRLLARRFDQVSLETCPVVTETLEFALLGPRPITYISCSADFSMDRL